MNQSERKKLHIARCLIEGTMTISDAAKVSELCERQWKRIKKGVSIYGDAFVIHKSKSLKPHNAVTGQLRKQVEDLKNSDKYCNANFSHFQELLADKESICLSKPTVYRILVESGLKSPKAHERVNVHRRRTRKPQKGMLVLVDASPFKWLCDGVEYSLHGAVDDAGGDILSLFFTRNECLEGYFQMIHSLLSQYGAPLALYVDKHAIFLSQCASRVTVQDELEGKKINDTHFGRAMRELDIRLIYANSPQAKGRIERMWGTLQSRLPVDLKLAGIDNISDANSFLEKYIHDYNKRFAVKPRQAESLFRPLKKDVNIDHILCTKETRCVDNGSTFSYSGTRYRLLCKGAVVNVIPKSEIRVLAGSRIGLKAEYSGVVYDVEQFEAISQDSWKKDDMEPKERKLHVPSANHPWRSHAYARNTQL